ncbi:LysR family transcriptional regulator ArgP [Conexibacter sp. CPCC 206217]|uniref:LysR family transcriptional regulator ArgP n=1 Tax=Conexibacter sp. CPCC 206217 TaxID=3064574 RepID=UPI00271EFBDA|nr:LysR family transcriptional regulator ArgP [Conexibacter sp. CPCC 206217]MDO8211130.1 LysR family transcriptional regulator ArgP [Conexibacter sp. CPCC 206217]
MDFDAQQLRALAAIAAGGSLDAAARMLHVTPSAVSQRLRALEGAAGRVLVVRSRPIRLTPSGEALLRLARQIALLEEEAARELAGGRDASERAILSVAVNADSLATWFLTAVAPLAAAVELRIHREDESRTGDLLRKGVTMAAVTTEREPLAGCRVTPLGAMRYRPMGSAAFAARWFAGTDADAAFERAPMVTFDDEDELQHRFLRHRVVDVSPPFHRIPSSADFFRAIQLGFGWGLVPELQAATADGLVTLADEHFDVPLYWQQWALDTASLTQLSEVVVAAGRAALVPWFD